MEDEDDQGKRGSAPYNGTLYHAAPLAAYVPYLNKKAEISVSPQNSPATGSDTFTKGIPTDPDVMPSGQSQWHLVGTWGLNAHKVWADYTGDGSMVAVLDDGFQYTHHEISANYRTDLDRDIPNNDSDAAPVTANDKHGTSVIGTIIADDNGSGTVGVAFDADAYGVRLDFSSATIDHMVSAFQHVLNTGADVINNSWGFTSPFADTTQIDFAGQDFITLRDTMRDLAEDGRGGLGTNIVFSAGNARSGGDNVNYHSMQNSPYTIAVAAIDPDGTYSSFSTPGAAILVAAGGTQVYTTDRTDGGYVAGDYTNFSGTSASAPIVSGMIAVLLEANENLGWRDVQEILAYSAQHNDPTSNGWQYNGATNWNGGGLHFSHDYGFGAADLFTAVRLAETWSVQQTSANQTILAPVTASPNIAIPGTGTITTTINIASDIEIERVLIDLNISHAKAGDLVVTLISPDGTESVLINHPANGTFTGIYGFTGIDFETTSTAHWGESSSGTWTLKIEDTAAGNAGTLNSWGLSFMGNAQSNNDVYIYTQGFANISGAELSGRTVITDSNGGTDILNLAAVTSHSTVNLASKTGNIAGTAVTLSAGTTIETIYGGDGNDNFTGDSANNTIYGERGDDTLYGGAGNDTLDGGAGTDKFLTGYAISQYTFSFINASTVQAAHSVDGIDILRNIENFSFNNVLYNRAQLEAYADGSPPGVINGTSGNDTLTGTNAADTINGLAGNDVLNGGDGNDTLNGGDGNDTLNGGLGNDVLNGGAGANILHGNDGTDKVLYAGTSAGFIVYRDNASYLTLLDTNTNSSSKLYTMEQVQFSDTTLDLTATTFTLGGEGWGRSVTVSGTTAAQTLNGTAAIDEIHGDAGNDTISGKAGNDFLYGDDGNDRLNGDAGNDTLNGGAGNDTLFGGAGNDTLNGGTGTDIIYGDAGTDTIAYAGASSGFILYRDNANYLTLMDTNTNSTSKLYSVERVQFSNIVLDLTALTFTAGGAGWGSAVTVNGTSSAQTINGTASTDTIYGAGGNDTINGKAGNDTLHGDDGDDRIYGGDGDDILNGGAGKNTLYGDAGTDKVVYSGTSAGFIVYRDNASYLTLLDTNTGASSKLYTIEQIQFSNVTLDLTSLPLSVGGAGWGTAVTVNGTSLAQTINGFAAADEIHGAGGNDTIYGKAGNDILHGDDGDDRIYGGDGNDILNGGTGSNTLYGDAGTDKVAYSCTSAGFIIYRDNASYLTLLDTNTNSISKLYTIELIQFSNITVDLTSLPLSIGGAGWGTAVTVNGTDLAQTISGTAGIDDIHGAGGNDTISGKAGNDSLYGDDGNDRLNGDAGDDTLVGGAGLDQLYGGAGNDEFGFITLAGGIDKVNDFAAGDRLNITDILSGFTAGADDISDFVMLSAGTTTRTFSINTDGIGNDFVQAFTVTGAGLAGQTAQSLLDAGILVTNQSLF